MTSIFFLPDSVLPVPEKGTLGFASAGGAALEVVVLAVADGAGFAPVGSAAPVLARPERVLPAPTPAKGTAG